MLRLQDTLRWQGIRGLTFRLRMHAGYRSAGWFVRPLDVPIAPAKPRVPARIGTLSMNDVEAYRLLRPETSAETFRSRLEAGHHCFAAWAEDQLVSVTWVGVGVTWLAFFSRDLRLEPGEIYLYDAHTHPQHRGQQLQPALVAAALAHFRAAGFKRAFSLIGLHNRSNVVVRERAGFRLVGMMGQVRVGRFHWNFFRGRRDEREPARKTRRDA